MTILVDINVFEDIFRQRTGWEATLGIVRLLAKGRLGGYVSALTPAIVYFPPPPEPWRARGASGRSRDTSAFRIVSLDSDAVDAAYGSALPDFEDALQVAAARRRSSQRRTSLTACSPGHLQCS